MRVLYVDVDSLRPDHLGCYGYHRDTSPSIDALAAEGRRFENVYAADTPCLPSRTGLFTCRFGIHTGVVNHGGLAADPRPTGRERGFSDTNVFRTFTSVLRDAGYRTATISPFPTRHGAFHMLDGFREWHDTGPDDADRADRVVPYAERWLDDHAGEDDWLLHVNLWDPHCPYDTPESFGNPFEDDPGPDWPDGETIDAHRESYGQLSARDTIWYAADRRNTHRTPDEIRDRSDFGRWIDGYDAGIRFADDAIGDICDTLREHGIFEDTLIVVSADHGENQGELNVYGDHETADEATTNVPLVMRGPGVEPGVDDGLRYHLDLGPTLVDLAGEETWDRWDGESFAAAVGGQAGDGATGRDELVLSHGAWSCQRAVRWEDWLLIRTYHDGLKDLDDVMLFDVREDPHETENLADDRPDVVAEGTRRLEGWVSDRLSEAARDERGGTPHTPDGTQDPLWTVIEEGGPYHPVRGADVGRYVKRLRDTGRGEHADRIEAEYVSDG